MLIILKQILNNSININTKRKAKGFIQLVASVLEMRVNG